jgi:hypothetical protein
MYKLSSNLWNGSQAKSVIRTTDGACIPFDPQNVDFQTFKKEVLAGAELQDADGDVMSQKDAEAFINSLP